jgi:hypothetical protein
MRQDRRQRSKGKTRTLRSHRPKRVRQGGNGKAWIVLRGE